MNTIDIAGLPAIEIVRRGQQCRPYFHVFQRNFRGIETENSILRFPERRIQNVRRIRMCSHAPIKIPVSAANSDKLCKTLFRRIKMQGVPDQITNIMMVFQGNIDTVP